ncbi:retrotransposon protein [Cucumis melo var. makuwa]|uniref:Retrotransposon protein n=1 Tax=Cucumis melo var. makuwa TaxID=1194695 RepID=A0A5A7VCL3_CUCMM|nr:retrotransposon protein [Cucumis melo var. makuwa]TYJ99825.1 retrotransposon protein [Cucumis melo var. makuwa]
MSEEGVCASRPSRALEGRAGSSRSKRKRGSQREGEIEVIHMALKCTNDQLMTIMEWPASALANNSHVRQEFFRILLEMPQLTSLDKVWMTCGVSYKCLMMGELLQSLPTRHL